MTWAPPDAIVPTAPPPEEEVPPPAAAAPAPAPQTWAPPDAVAPAPAAQDAPPPEQQTAPAPAPAPVQAAANAVGTFLQEQVVTPASQFVPEGVKQEIGPRASGAVGAVGQVGQAAAQMGDAAINLDPAGVVTPLLHLANQPFEQTAAGQGERAVDPNRGRVPSLSEVAADPSQAMQVIPGWWNTEGPGSWAAGGSLEEYAQAHPEIPAEQVYESWKQEAGLENIPAGVVNPLDEANVGDAAAAIPEFVGSVKDSASQGRLGPFLKAQLVDIGNDPTIPAQLGLAALSGGASLGAGVAGRAGLSGVESVLRGATTAGRALNRAADVALDPTATASEVLKPAARGAKNLAGLTDKSAASRATNLAEQDYELATRYLPELRQPASPTPSLPPAASNTLFNPQPGTTPRQLETAGRADPYQRAQSTPEAPSGVSNPRTGQPLTAPSSPPTRRADRDSLGVQGGVWRTARGQDVVRNNTIEAAHLGTTRRVYDEMLSAPAETFWENFPTSHPKGDVPAEAADGFYARWRAAMRQGLWLLDDWSEARVRRQFPDAARPDGTLDWESLTRRAADGDTSAKRAMAGKRAHDLYVHRVAGATDPDREVYNLVATYHLDQMSGRFSGPQYGPDYWKQRAEAIGEVLQDAGYTPSSALLARLNATSLKTLASTDFPHMRASDKKMLSQGGVITLHRPGGVTPLTPQPRTARDPNPLPTTSYGGLSVAQRQRAQVAGPLDDAALDEVRELRFANGSKETAPLREVLTKLRSEAEQWVDMARDPSLQTGRGAAKWASLSKKFGDDGSLDPTTLLPAQVDELVALRLVEAAERVLPAKGGAPPKSGVAQAYQSLLAFNRGARLFNILNIPRYVLQNLFGNTAANVIAGRPRAALRLFSDLGQKADTLKHLRNPGKHTSMAEDMMRATGLGVDRSITQTNRAMLDLAPSGQVRQGRIADIVMPQWQKDLAQVVDVSHRTGLYEETLLTGYRRLNQDLARGVKEWNGKYGLPYTDRQIDEVVGDFLAERRVLIDGATGEPHTGLLGRTDRYEPIWSSQEFNGFLRERLTAIAPPTSLVADDPLGLLLRRVGADNTASIRAIRAASKAEVERVAFDWKNTNLDEALSNVFLYHFWNSRAGLLYLKQGLKNPAMLAAYGRMMEDFQTQIDLFDGPDWLKGWFQFLNTPAGYSIWFSPADLLGTMLTFADWQMDSGDNPFNDLTGLGQKREKTPWMPNPLLDGLLYSLGLYGPDARAPDVLGLGRMWTLGTTLLNKANFEGVIPWANALGIGVDAQGNKVPLKLKGLDELYARFANGLSAAVSPITGMRPVAVPDGDASARRTDMILLDQNFRAKYPELSEFEIQGLIQQALFDPGSPEMQEAFGQRVDLQLTTGSPLGIDLPGPLRAALRLASPVPIYAAPEQAMRGGTLKALPAYQAATVPPMHGEGADTAKYRNQGTLEGRELNMANDAYKNAGDPLVKLSNSIYYGNTQEDVVIGGTTYTPADLAAIAQQEGEGGPTLKALSRQFQDEQGITWDQIQANKDAGATYLADNPQLQAYKDWQSAAYDHPGGTRGALDELIATNPAYADYMQRNAFSLTTQQLDYSKGLYPDAYLAAQGIRPTVWEPISAPVGGPPEAAAPKPQVTPVDDLGEEGITLRKSPGSDGEAVANVSPGVPMTNLEQQGDWMRVAVADDEGGGPLEGWVPVGFLRNLPSQASGLNAVGMGLAGGVQQGVGSLIDAAGAVVGTMVGGGIPSKPAETSRGIAPGTYDVVPAVDGIGEQSTRAGSDRTWMELMLGNNAQVTTDYKGPPTANMSYQVGHGADETTHAAYDISCASGNCEGTPVTSPVAGKVVCAGYGQGTGESLAGCTYSQNTTFPGSAHTVVIEVGRDAAGNPIQLSFSHMGESTLQPGQTVNVGDPIGTMGNTDGGAHVHLEGWLGDPANGYILVDPQLVVGGHYGPVQSSATQAASPSGPSRPTLDFLAPLGAAVSGMAPAPGAGALPAYGDTMGTVGAPADHYADLPASGGDWSILDQFNEAYPAAATQVGQETGVTPPPDLLKALNAMESGYGRINPPTGVRTDVRDKPLAGFVGVFKDAADSWGADFERMTTDPEYAIYGMALGLGRIANWDATQYGASSGTVYENYGWDGVLAIYYSGKPHLDAPQPADDTTTVRQYVENINAMRAQLK